MRITFLFTLLLPLCSAAPIEFAGLDKKVDAEADHVHDGSHSHREGNVFIHNQIGLGDIDVSGSVKGDDVSIGHQLEINVHGQGGSFDGNSGHAHEHSGHAQGDDGHAQGDDSHVQGLMERDGRKGFRCMFYDTELGHKLEPGMESTPVDHAYKWDHEIIPYFFSSTSVNDQKLFRSVMDIIEEKTCFEFQNETKAECEMKPCLEIMTESKSCSTGCKGYVGMANDTLSKRVLLRSYTQVSDQENCALSCQGFALHELMHVLGVGHTINRDDRDQFIIFNTANIAKLKLEDGFKKCENCLLYGDTYDCHSIMHLGTHLNGTELVKPKNPNTCNLTENAKWEYGPNGSDLDWKLLNDIGNCSGTYEMYTVKKCWSVDKTKRVNDEYCSSNCLHTSPECPEYFCKCAECTTDYGRCNGKKECTDGLDEQDCLVEGTECRSVHTTTTDEWCTRNCQHTPPNCPANRCKCDTVWYTPFESTASRSCLDYIVDKQHWTGNLHATLVITLVEDITSYEIQMETDVLLTKLLFNNALTSPHKGTRFNITSKDDFNRANKGQKLNLRFELSYEGSEEPTTYSIILNGNVLCNDSSVCTAGEISSGRCICKAESTQKRETCLPEQKCNEDGTCIDVMSTIDAIRGLRVTAQLIFNELEKNEYTIKEEEQQHVLDLMSSSTGYLKDYCSSTNSNCESETIVRFKKQFESLSKFQTENVDSGFLSSLKEKNEDLDLVATESEGVFKPPTKPATVCDPGPTCACENAAEPCEAGEFCTEGRCLKGCGASVDLNKIQFLEADCFCNENAGQICPQSYEADKKRCGGGNICDNHYGCTQKVCPLWFLLIG